MSLERRIAALEAALDPPEPSQWSVWYQEPDRPGLFRRVEHNQPTDEVVPRFMLEGRPATTWIEWETGGLDGTGEVAEVVHQPGVTRRYGGLCRWVPWEAL